MEVKPRYGKALGNLAAALRKAGENIQGRSPDDLDDREVYVGRGGGKMGMEEKKRRKDGHALGPPMCAVLYVVRHRVLTCTFVHLSLSFFLHFLLVFLPYKKVSRRICEGL